MKLNGVFPLLLALIFGPPVLASNPLIRICNLTGGQFESVRISEDTFGLCRYGTATMDSQSILNVTSNQTKSIAVKAIESTASKSCLDWQGTIIEGYDFNGRSVLLCEFQDLSLIEARTLDAGPSAPQNSGLMKAIRTRF